MPNPDQFAKHRKVLAGICIFLFAITLLMLELSFIGLADKSPEILRFRQAIPNTVVYPLTVGVLLGHWFHPGTYEGNPFGMKGIIGVIIGACIAAVLIGIGIAAFLTPAWGFVIPGWTMLLTGLTLGCLLWAV